MREALRNALGVRETPGKWGFLTNQIGMFSYTGFTPDQVAYLRDKWHVYMVPTGRMAVCGLTWDNVEYIADAVDDMVRNGPQPKGKDNPVSVARADEESVASLSRPWPPSTAMTTYTLPTCDVGHAH